MSTRSYAVIGTGAVGGFYGARLHHAGLDVHFLTHNDFAHVSEKGILVESQDDELIVTRLHAYREAAAMPACDVALIALKSTQNHLLPSILPHVLKPDGVALVLQNGLGLEEEIARIVGPDRVMGGLCFIAASRVGPGRIRHIDYSEILLAEFSANCAPRGITDRMRSVGADFESARVPIRLEEDLLGARWHKLVWNVPFSGLSVLLRTSTDRLMAVADGRLLVERIMREVVGAARACGRTIEEEFVHRMLDDTLRLKPYKASMMLDFEARRPMEIEAIYGNPVRAAHQAGAHVPLMEGMYHLLRFLDHENRAAT